MNLITLLKQIKNIEPDPGYTERSRRAILAGLPKRVIFPTPWQIFSTFVQSGTAFTFAVIFLLVAAGGFSTWKFLSPLKLSGLDPQSIKAEAQAVDIQIQLTNVSYPDKTTAPEATPVSPEKQHATTVKKLAERMGLDSPATSSEPMGIDDALDKLSQ